MPQPEPDQCWALERVPWWEPPYILHLRRQEVKLGRSQENNKVCRGYLVSRHHALFIRSGSPDDWRTVRWSLRDEGSGQGTFVNGVRVERGQDLVLNADDLIGFGCSDAVSSRSGGKESFVYRFRAPEAFQRLETEEDILDIPDTEAPTPPPPDLPDLVPPQDIGSGSMSPAMVSLPSSSGQSLVSLPSTSSKSPPATQSSSSSDVIDLITLESSEEDASRSPHESFNKIECTEEGLKTSSKRNSDDVSPPSQQHNCKKFKNLFGSDDEDQGKQGKSVGGEVSQQSKILSNKSKKVETKSKVKSLSKEAFLDQFSPISSDDDIPGSFHPPASAMDLSKKVVKAHETPLDPKPRPNVAKSVRPSHSSSTPSLDVNKEKSHSSASQESTMSIEDLAAKIIASKEKHQSESSYASPNSHPNPRNDEGHPMVKIEMDQLVQIKKEPTEQLVSWPKLVTNGYSDEPEVITLYDSDDEEAFANSFADGNEINRGEDVDNVPRGSEEQENHDSDSDDEVQIISASDTSLFQAISRRIKIEYEEKSGTEESDCDTQDRGQDDLLARIMERVGCNRDSALEGLETARQMFATVSPSEDQVVKVLVGEGDGDAVDDDLETFEDKFDKFIDGITKDDNDDEEVEIERKIPSRSSSGSANIDDLLGDSDEENDQRSKVTKNLVESTSKTEEKSIKSKSKPVPDQSEPSTSSGSAKPLPTLKKNYKVPKLSKPSKEDERQSMLAALKSSKPQPSNQSRNATNSNEVKAMRKQKLAEIERKKTRHDPEVRSSNVPAGIMKESVPRSQKLLNEFVSNENLQPKRKIVKKFDIPKLPRVQNHQLRLDSIPNELHSGEQLSREIPKATKPGANGEAQLYSDTDDGYKVPKKMSISNVQYSNEAPESLAAKESGVRTPMLKPIIKKKKRIVARNIRWADQDGFKHKLVLVKMIPCENSGTKVSKGNNKDGSVKVKVASVNTSSNNDKKIITIDDILQTILHWNPAWLEEQKQQSEPPPVHQPWQLIPVTSTFTSWQEYRRIFLPLMLQELWSSVSRDYEERKVAGSSSLPVFMTEVFQDHGGQFLTVRCLAVMSERQLRAELCSEGSLVQLDVMFTLLTPEGKRVRQVRPTFAFVWTTKRDLLRKDDKSLGEADTKRIKDLQSLSSKAHGPAPYNHLVHLTLRLKQNLVTEGSQLASDKPVKMRTLSRIKPELRKFTAMLELPQSRLFESIISPSPRLAQVDRAGSSLHASIHALPGLARLNSVQREIIVGVAAACVQRPDLARVCLVQGPPGTGKSSTITGLILQILYTSLVPATRAMSRILVVAPSNAAVDQLALKLIAVQAQLPDQERFSLLRLGVTSSMHQAVRPFCFDSLVEQQRAAQTRHNKASDTIERDIRAKQQAAEQLLADQRRAEASGRRDLAAKLRRDHRDKLAQVDKLRAEMKKPLNHKSRKDVERIAVERTLAEADVILTTLSSSLTSHMEKYLVHGLGTSKAVGPLRPVSVCIMDEASQAVEPEALIPLKYGFCKLVMVGDHEQLPATVTSRKAQQLDYQQSLFSRLISCLSGAGAGSPVLRLDTQYRMHPDIGDWPARYFYGGKLSHAAPVRNFGLAPVTCLHVVGDTLQADGACWNKVEERVVMATIEAVKSLVGEELNIGVISFYAKQKQNIAAEVTRRRMVNVVVNTVDGFQGSERDVIVISCVRSGAGTSIGFLQDRQRLNVALTRAKHCLVVVGDTAALSKASQMWGEFIAHTEKKKFLSSLKGDLTEGILHQKMVKLLRGR